LTSLFAVAVQGAGVPDFSGAWKMNASKSDLGQMPAPEKYELKVEHKEPEIKAETVMVGQMGEWKTTAVYQTNGTETVNKMGPNDSKSTAKWEGNVLKVVTKTSWEGNAMEIQGKWSLSEDGKTLTMEQTIRGDQGEFAMKWVLDKQ
jgi:hypothetical protein